MRLLLIRHGETVDNVAGIYAGTTDSPLTNHGVLQTERLGAFLSKTDVKISHIFSSDLQRAFKTAEAIRSYQSVDTIVQLPLLQEQDFGFYEGKRFTERPKGSTKGGREAHFDAHKDDPGFRDVESKDAMRLRADSFIDQHLLGCLSIPHDETVVVVAHGIILNHLWRGILKLFQPGKVAMASGVVASDRGLEYLGGWSNTGYLELEIKPQLVDQDMTNTQSAHASDEATAEVVDVVQSGEVSSGPPESVPSMLPNLTLVVKAVNNLEHLKGLKKTRGGIGSLKHDSKQKTVDSFFKKRRLE